MARTGGGGRRRDGGGDGWGERRNPWWSWEPEKVGSGDTSEEEDPWKKETFEQRVNQAQEDGGVFETLVVTMAEKKKMVRHCEASMPEFFGKVGVEIAMTSMEKLVDERVGKVVRQGVTLERCDVMG